MKRIIIAVPLILTLALGCFALAETTEQMPRVSGMQDSQMMPGMPGGNHRK